MAGFNSRPFMRICFFSPVIKNRPAVHAKRFMERANTADSATASGATSGGSRASSKGMPIKPTLPNTIAAPETRRQVSLRSPGSRQATPSTTSWTPVQSRKNQPIWVSRAGVQSVDKKA